MNDSRTEPSSRRPRLVVYLSWGLIGLLLLVIPGVGGFALWFRHAAVTALPQLDGELRVAGLKAPVSVTRDRAGTPCIHADDLEDLFFAQGYVTAQDRLFQMDTGRRYAAGELSEIIGFPLVRGEAAASLLEHDIRQRYLQVRRAAERMIRQASERDRLYFDAYARGVNAFIGTNRDRLPVEFRFLRYQPGPWRASDSALVGLNVSLEMNSQYPVEWWRDRFARQLPPQMLDDLYVNGSWRDRAPGESGEQQKTGTVVRAIRPAGGFSAGRQPARTNLLGVFLAQAATGDDFGYNDDIEVWPGSNNWVVSGRHTASGKPLLSNDMHLMHTMPCVWYQAHLVSGNFNVVGYTLPGMPFVIGGHNEFIAWGFTNLGPDVQDLYVESFNERGEYQTPSGWVEPEKRREVVRVKGKPDVILEVEVTRHGPVISPILKDEKRKIALRWIANEPVRQGFPFGEIDSARNWPEFRAALSGYVAPAMNLVYADAEGNIGYQAAGRIPIRAAGDGLSLVRGEDDAHEWVGYIPWDEMPSVFNPPDGLLATANSRITPQGYKYHAANQWASAHRTWRIYQVLESWIARGKKLTPADMLSLQTDVYSDFDRLLAVELARPVLASNGASAQARRAAEILNSWDGSVTPDSTAAGLINLARRSMTKLVLEPRLGQDYRSYRWFGATTFWENLITQKPARWLPPNVSSFDELYIAVVEDVAADRGLPDDLAQFTYGMRFPVEIDHPIFGSIPLLRRYAGPGAVPQRGDGSTVNQAGARYGPSQRLTVDFGNLDRSTSSIVTGQSGQIFSPQYMDQFPVWLRGATLPLPFSGQAVAASKSHELVLRPDPPGRKNRVEYR
ncbi:MAG: Penicillin amidase [Acidobacteria bacterium]|nr:Penicillin amidase [Acidobacteriota bacterium]